MSKLQYLQDEYSYPNNATICANYQILNWVLIKFQHSLQKIYFFLAFKDSKIVQEKESTYENEIKVTEI